MLSLAQEAATLLATGEASVAVNCLSGRGRTGTFSAIVIGKLLKIKTLSELVDIIVGMRENRDGLVETPAQFRFAAHALNLPDPRECSTLCHVKRLLGSILRSHAYAPYTVGIFIGFVAFLILEVAAKHTSLHDALHHISLVLKAYHKALNDGLRAEADCIVE